MAISGITPQAAVAPAVGMPPVQQLGNTPIIIPQQQQQPPSLTPQVLQQLGAGQPYGSASY